MWVTVFFTMCHYCFVCYRSSSHNVLSNLYCSTEVKLNSCDLLFFTLLFGVNALYYYRIWKKACKECCFFLLFWSKPFIVILNKSFSERDLLFVISKILQRFILFKTARQCISFHFIEKDELWIACKNDSVTNNITES